MDSINNRFQAGEPPHVTVEPIAGHGLVPVEVAPQLEQPAFRHTQALAGGASPLVATDFVNPDATVPGEPVDTVPHLAQPVRGAPEADPLQEALEFREQVRNAMPQGRRRAGYLCGAIALALAPLGMVLAEPLALYLGLAGAGAGAVGVCLCMHSGQRDAEA